MNSIENNPIPLSYTNKDPISLDCNITPIVHKLFTEKSNFSMIENIEKDNLVKIRFFAEDKIGKDIHQFILQLILEKKTDNSKIIETTITVTDEDSSNINEYDLDSYIKGIYYSILVAERNKSNKTYIVRVYSSIFNSHPIKHNITLDYKYKTQLIPAPSNHRDEPNTEHIVIFDIELNAYSIEHARTIAYEHTSRLQAFLSVLLDVGFELVNSEFKTFIITEKSENKKLFKTLRYRTGYFDPDLKLVVKDNLNGLQHLEELEEDNSFPSGKFSLSLAEEDTNLPGKIWHTFENKKSFKIEDTFLSRQIKKTSKSQHNEYLDGISKNIHYPSDVILFPREVRNYFRGISQASPEKQEAFQACAYMYNLALKLRRSEPTAFMSYLVCAIEALSNYQYTDDQTGFSKFISHVMDEKFDKKLFDHFYRIRSSHFHAGKFAFSDNSPSLLAELDLLFSQQRDLFYRFHAACRNVIITWVEKEILSKS